jgi:capsular exopolysaccharide synthesis family protein
MVYTKHHESRGIRSQKYYRDTPGLAEIERIVAELEALRKGKKNQFTLITSALSGEGKSTIASLLARVMAFHQKKALLIDFDIRRPRLDQILHSKHKNGLIETLRSELPAKTYIRNTAIPNLFFLNSGKLKKSPAEIFNSDKIEYLFLDIADSFENVIIDSPPVIPVSDSLLLSTYIDEILLVVKAGSTPKYIVKRAISMFNKVNAKITGIVLNNMQNVLPHYYDYKYYGYKYYEPLKK